VCMQMKCLVDAGWSDLGAFGENLSRLAPWLFSTDSGHTIHDYLEGTHPDMAWGIFVVAMVFLYLSLTRSGRRRV
jgi:hypothetical protein